MELDTFPKEFAQATVGNIVTQLRTHSVGARVDKWIWMNLPELRTQQQQAIRSQLEDNSKALAPEIRQKFPKPLIDADSVMNAAFAMTFAKIDRARFVPNSLQAEAWADHPLSIEDEATISQPSLVAQMTEWLEISTNDSVLEIGTGSGYQTAILAKLAAEVATVEFSSTLSRTARVRLEDLGYTNVHFHNGDGAEGWPEHSPYDRILATVAFPEKPTALLDQLSPENGIALVPVGPPGGTQHLTRYQRSGDDVTEERLLPVRFLSLR